MLWRKLYPKLHGVVFHTYYIQYNSWYPSVFFLVLQDVSNNRFYRSSRKPCACYFQQLVTFQINRHLVSLRHYILICASPPYLLLHVSTRNSVVDYCSYLPHAVSLRILFIVVPVPLFSSSRRESSEPLFSIRDLHWPYIIFDNRNINVLLLAYYFTAIVLLFPNSVQELFLKTLVVHSTKVVHTSRVKRGTKIIREDTSSVGPVLKTPG